LVLRWQRDWDPKVLDEILTCSEPVLSGILLTRTGYPTGDFDETLNVLRARLWQKLPAFDPGRGRIFTYISLISHRTVSEIQARHSLRTRRYPEVGLGVVDYQWEYAIQAEIRRTENLDDLIWRIRQVQTICTDERELSAQRWLVRGQLAADFGLRRHEMADSMSLVFGLSHSRARQICDLTVLEIRRQLLDVVEIPAIDVSRLVGTRGKCLARFSGQLSSSDFSRLAFLLRGLSPMAVIPPVDRIDLVLTGFPNAQRLFQ
jgi:hypothetical protein